MKESNLDEYNSFYQFSKSCHLPVAREGEESQEDILKIRSDENFLESWLWIFKKYFYLISTSQVNWSWASA